MPRNRYCSNSSSDDEQYSCQCRHYEKEVSRKCSKKEHRTCNNCRCNNCHSNSCHRSLKEIKHTTKHQHNCCNNHLEEEIDNCKKECQNGKVILITIS